MGSSMVTKPFPLCLGFVFCGCLADSGRRDRRPDGGILGFSQKELTTPERAALCGALGLGILQYVLISRVWLDQQWPGVAASILEGVDEMSFGLQICPLIGVQFWTPIPKLRGSILQAE
jgi:hypothetical protein